MVQVKVFTKEGHSHTFRKPCFGFMAYINSWGDEIFDEVLDENGVRVYVDEDEAHPYFKSHLLKSLDWRLGYLSKTNCNTTNIPYILKAMKSYPQYYDDVTVSGKGEDLTFTFPLEDVPMQKTIVGAMMLRNVLDRSSHSSLFQKSIEMGFSPKFSFLLAQMFYICTSFDDEDSICSLDSRNDDDTIFSDFTRVCDLECFLNHKLGDVWQGVWGDTENGYGREGDYDGCDAPRSKRTGYRSELIDIILSDDPSAYEGSPFASSIWPSCEDNIARFVREFHDNVKCLDKTGEVK